MTSYWNKDLKNLGAKREKWWEAVIATVTLIICIGLIWAIAIMVMP